MSTTSKKWSDENTKTLVEAAGEISAGEVSAETILQIADDMEFTPRSISSKLRKLGYTVASLAKSRVSAFSEEDTEALREFLADNEGTLTYAEIAANFKDGEFTAKQIQGKILALELTGMVKASEKVEAVRKYTDQEEAAFIQMANSGACIEDIAQKLGKEVPSIRGKALALLSQKKIDRIPVQRESSAKTREDVFESLDNINAMTVEEIAEATGKTVRGVKSALTHRGVKVANYDGAAKKAKALGKNSEDSDLSEED